MDSVTQFVLGACVGTAILGRRLGPRKAAVLGGVLATVPDLDVFFPYDDPIDSFTLHRGPSHSLLVHALVTPVFGEVILRLFRKFRDEGAAAHRLSVYLAVFLVLSTHALLDALTIYGTQLLWPISTEPIGLGSMFIIDPIYTLPLLILTVWMLCLKQWGRAVRNGLAIALVASTAYLGWAAIGQSIAKSRAVAAIGGELPEDRILATPTPFNTLFWKVLVLRDDDYINVYVPLLGDDRQITAYQHPRDWLEIGCSVELPELDRVARFSQGFVRVEQVDNRIQIADLRMGLTPNYVFRFAVAEFSDGTAGVLAPERVPGPRSADSDQDWLRSGILGYGTVRVSEESAAMSLPLAVKVVSQAHNKC